MNYEYTLSQVGLRVGTLHLLGIKDSYTTSEIIYECVHYLYLCLCTVTEVCVFNLVGAGAWVRVHFTRVLDMNALTSMGTHYLGVKGMVTFPITLPTVS